MLVFVASGVGNLAEANFECYFLADIAVEIKTKGVKPLVPEKYRVRRFRHPD